MTLTERQKALANFLIGKPGQFVTREEICESLKELYPRHLEKTSKENSSAFREIRGDVDALNRCNDFEKVIVSGSKGYKIGSAKECLDFYEKRVHQHLRAMKCDWAILRKMQNNGQIKIADDYLKVIETFSGESNG